MFRHDLKFHKNRQVATATVLKEEEAIVYAASAVVNYELFRSQRAEKTDQTSQLTPSLLLDG